MVFFSSSRNYKLNIICEQEKCNLEKMLNFFKDEDSSITDFVPMLRNEYKICSWLNRRFLIFNSKHELRACIFDRKKKLDQSEEKLFRAHLHEKKQKKSTL